MKSKDSAENEVSTGDSIKVLEIDKRITEYLPEDEKEELASFIGDVLIVKKINTDGSMLVGKTWEYEKTDGMMGHEVAIFPKGALLVHKA